MSAASSTTMSGRERVMTAMRRRTPDRVPFDFSQGFSPAKLEEFRQRTGADSPDDYFGVDVRGVHIAGTRQATDFSAYHPDLPPRTHVDEWGIGHQATDSRDAQHSHLSGFVYPMLRLETRQDALDYPLPDIEADYRYAHLPGQIAAIQAAGLAATAGLECTIFEIAWYMRSMERLLVDFLEGSEFAETLLDRITAMREVQAARYAEAGADIIRLGDDVASQRGMLMRVPLWRRWLKGRLARVIAAAKRVKPDLLIFYHSDGDVTPLLEDLIEIGVDILNPVQPECMDGAALKARYGDRIAFWGGMGTQSTLPFGTPNDVRAVVKERIATMGAGGGLFLAPTHVVEPEVPWENIVAFVEAVHEYGRYA